MNCYSSIFIFFSFNFTSCFIPFPKQMQLLGKLQSNLSFAVIGFISKVFRFKLTYILFNYYIVYQIPNGLKQSMSRYFVKS